MIPVPNLWYHVIYSYNVNTGDVKLYVNGNLEEILKGDIIGMGIM